ncbi:AcrR family transcriptional regulator [Streptacidiphilus sp. MAP12-20]|uniref:TetR/AcrR family transcriptional regulator n=1 Tax=Streptacidiphilus sp. MAP12-20 TaxID=3156299 RepID=UPI003516E286
MQHDPTRRPTIGRGAKVRAAVLAATVDELLERGYATLTIDQIAQRAGVHKTTVYRRWSDLDTLVVDALTGHIAPDIPIPDTGDIAEDLRLLARGLVAWINSPSGRAVLAVMLSDAGGRIPELAEGRRRIFHDRIERARPVVTRAVERGELPPGTDAAELIKDLAAPVYFRVLITGEPVDERTADRAAAMALVAARSA